MVYCLTKQCSLTLNAALFDMGMQVLRNLKAEGLKQG